MGSLCNWIVDRDNLDSQDFLNNCKCYLEKQNEVDQENI